MTLGSEAGSLNHFSLGNTSNELPILPEVIQPAAKVCDFEEVLFCQVSRFRYSGMRIIGMLCLQCSLLDDFSSGSFLRCEPVLIAQAC